MLIPKHSTGLLEYIIDEAFAAAIGNEAEQIWYAFNLLKDNVATLIHPWMDA
jgi:hypothetical protein